MIKAIASDYLRVELRGAATILDVTYSARSLPDSEETFAQTMHDFQIELRHCERQTESLEGRLQRLEKQRSVLDTFADGLAKQTNEDAMTPPPLPPVQVTQQDKMEKNKKGAPEPHFTPAMKAPSTCEVSVMPLLFIFTGQTTFCL